MPKKIPSLLSFSPRVGVAMLAACLVLLALAACNPNGAEDPKADVGFAIDVVEDSIQVTRSEATVTASVTVTVEREEGHEEDIVIGGTDVPTGMSVHGVTIPAEENSTTVSISVESNASLGSSTVAVEGVDRTNTEIATVEVFVKDPPGTRDATFGADGLVVHEFADTVWPSTDAIVTLENGKILVAGRHTDDVGTIDSHDDVRGVFLARFNADGTLDEAFGTGGIAHYTHATTLTFVYDLVVQGDRLLVAFAGLNAAGDETHSFIVAFDDEGEQDSTFGDDGVTTVDLGDDTRLQGLAVTSEGAIVAGGSVENGVESAFAATRLTSAGDIDTNFGVDGLASVDAAVGDADADVVLTPDGDILVAGEASATDSDFAVARFNADGSVDTAFGGDGLVHVDFGHGVDEAQAIVARGDEIVIGGRADTATSAAFALTRLHADGTIDTSFGDDGLVTTQVGNSRDFINDLALQDNGKIVAVGTAHFGPGDPATMTLARYTEDGQLDTDTDATPFTEAGMIEVLPSDAPWLTGDAVALYGGSRIVAVGIINHEFVIARYWR